MTLMYKLVPTVFLQPMFNKKFLSSVSLPPLLFSETHFTYANIRLDLHLTTYNKLFSYHDQIDYKICTFKEL